jgi:hypothetical protein
LLIKKSAVQQRTLFLFLFRDRCVETNVVSVPFARNGYFSGSHSSCFLANMPQCPTNIQKHLQNERIILHGNIFGLSKQSLQYKQYSPLHDRKHITRIRNQLDTKTHKCQLPTIYNNYTHILNPSSIPGATTFSQEG